MTTKYISMKDASQRLGVSRQFLAGVLREKGIKFYYVDGRKVVIRERDLNQLITTEPTTKRIPSLKAV